MMIMFHLHSEAYLCLQAWITVRSSYNRSLSGYEPRYWRLLAQCSPTALFSYLIWLSYVFGVLPTQMETIARFNECS